MFDPRRYIGTFAVLALVLLRVVVGWHFFREGTQKVEYDRHDGQLRLVFSAEGFLKQAKGPLADWYQAQAPDGHGWQQSLAVPRENKVLSAEVRAQHVAWESDYTKRRDEAIQKGELAPFEFAPGTPFHDWATRIVADWRATLDALTAKANLTDEQIKQAHAAYAARLEELGDYLAGESEAISEYRHELTRVDKWRNSAEAQNVPFVDERIAAKEAELAVQPAKWVAQVGDLERSFHDDLRGILTIEQRGKESTSAAVDDALGGARQERLDTMNLVVTVLTIAVGVCLLVGFLTRLAAVAGAVFLVGVIASQPPWIYDAIPTMPQWIECAALLVLAGTGAGRWLGLDYFLYALFHRGRTVTVHDR